MMAKVGEGSTLLHLQVAKYPHLIDKATPLLLLLKRTDTDIFACLLGSPAPTSSSRKREMLPLMIGCPVTLFSQG